MRIFRSYRQKTHGIAKALRCPERPRLKLIASPLESVVSMPELPGGQTQKLHIIFRIGRRQYHSAWSSALKQHTLKSSKAGRVQFLNDCFLSCLELFYAVQVRTVFCEQSSQGLAGEAALMFEIAVHDQFLLRVRSQPVTAMAQQFLNLVIAHPIMLLIVQDGDKNV